MHHKIKTYVRALEKEALPQLSVNCVIFGFHEKSLKVIVNKIALGRKNIVVLPGGYVRQKEDLELAVERIVRESTGLEGMLFKQFAAFGNASRSFEKEFAFVAKLLSQKERKELQWISKRFVSICYLALVDFRKIQLKPTQFLEAAEWMDIDHVKKLSMDHADIAQQARLTLARELPYTPIASNLLPSRFTLPELQALIEAILGREIERANFRRKILSTGVLKKVGTDNSGKRRPADLYSFKDAKNTNLVGEYRLGF